MTSFVILSWNFGFPEPFLLNFIFFSFKNLYKLVLFISGLLVKNSLTVSSPAFAASIIFLDISGSFLYGSCPEDFETLLPTLCRLLLELMKEKLMTPNMHKDSISRNSYQTVQQAKTEVGKRFIGSDKKQFQTLIEHAMVDPLN